MSHEQARQFINEAGEAIRRGAFQEAVDTLERSIALDSSDSEAFVLRAVAYSHLDEPEKATESFREAISLAPHNPKAYYNFAVHLYALGEKAQALEMAREAMRLDPQHGSASDLVYRIEKETGAAQAADEAPAPSPTMAPPIQPQPDLSAPPEGAYYRGGYYDYQQPVHSLAFVERMGKTWTWIGWILSALGAVGFAFQLYVVFKATNLMNQAMNGASPFAMQSQVGHVGLQLFYYLILVLALIWMCFDIADRRENWFWMLPSAAACCCGANCIILAIYLLFGRTSR